MIGFRPLIGVSFCKQVSKQSVVGGDDDNVSVPLSGLASVNSSCITTTFSTSIVSVPLSGLASVNPTPFQAL